jgi:hypothetical protein
MYQLILLTQYNIIWYRAQISQLYYQQNKKLPCLRTFRWREKLKKEFRLEGGLLDREEWEEMGG